MKIKNISTNTLRWLIAIFYVSALIIQLLVVLKAIPYDWVNGGMSQSYESQLVQSLVSLVIISLLFTFVWKLVHESDKVKKWKLRVLNLITLFWLIGFFMQLAGTDFERYLLSLCLALGVVSHGILILRIRTTVSR